MARMVPIPSFTFTLLLSLLAAARSVHSFHVHPSHGRRQQHRYQQRQQTRSVWSKLHPSSSSHSLPGLTAVAASSLSSSSVKAACVRGKLSMGRHSRLGMAMTTAQVTDGESSPTSTTATTATTTKVQGLDDQFQRWKYLQELLEGDADPITTNIVLYQVLDGALKYRRPRGGTAMFNDDADSEDRRESGSDKTAATSTPVVELEDETPALIREKIERLLNDSSRSGSIDVFQSDKNGEDGDKHQVDQQEEQQTLLMLEQLEELLPDPKEDEDAHRSLWDLVLELHGREAVKINETKTPKDLDWKLRNVVARLLMHHDFLTLGIVDGPLV